MYKLLHTEVGSIWAVDLVNVYETSYCLTFYVLVINCFSAPRRIILSGRQFNDDEYMKHHPGIVKREPERFKYSRLNMGRGAKASAETLCPTTRNVKAEDYW
jgi:hypothetical protein